jgi:hypothetical protein
MEQQLILIDILYKEWYDSRDFENDIKSKFDNIKNKIDMLNKKDINNIRKTIKQLKHLLQIYNNFKKRRLNIIIKINNFKPINNEVMIVLYQNLISIISFYYTIPNIELIDSLSIMAKYYDEQLNIFTPYLKD